MPYFFSVVCQALKESNTWVHRCGIMYYLWTSCWRHQMETRSTLLTFCVGNSPVTVEFPSQRPVTRSLGVSFDLRLKKRLSKQLRCRWFETQPRSLWRHSSGSGPRRLKQNGINRRKCKYCVFMICIISGCVWLFNGFHSTTVSSR